MTINSDGELDLSSIPAGPTGVFAGNWTVNPTATIPNSTTLQLTPASVSQAGSGFFNTRVPISSFACTFTYTPSNESTQPADGFTAFILHTDSRGTAALGGNGNFLGYGGGGGITPSEAFGINLYPNNIPGYAWCQNGTVPATFTAAGTINVAAALNAGAGKT